MFVSDQREFVVCQVRHIAACEHVVARGGHIQTSQEVHERGLASTGWPDDRYELALFDAKRHTA